MRNLQPTPHVKKQESGIELCNKVHCKLCCFLHQIVLGMLANHAYICQLIQSFKGIDISTLSEAFLDSNDTDAKEMLKFAG